MLFAFRSVRRTLVAKTMLLLWLFVLAVGSANACVLQERQTGAPAQDDRVGIALHTPALAVRTIHDDSVRPAGDRRDHGADKQVCQDLCDETASAVVKTKSMETPPDAAPIAAPVAWSSRPLESGQAVARVAAQPPRVAAPVPILFLRLTI